MLFTPSVAFLTGSAGTGEWIVIGVVVLIVVGPKRLPEIARKIGRTMEVLRRAADEFKAQVMSMDQEVSTTVNSATKSEETSDMSHDAYSTEVDHDAGEVASSDYWEDPSLKSATTDADGLSAAAPDAADTQNTDAEKSTEADL